MDGRFLGLAILIIVMLAILEASAENFYAFRYGKRDGTEGTLFKSPRYSRRSDVSNDLFLGSRYGKRNATPSLGSAIELGDRPGRSLEKEMSRSNRFYAGSRFGKRGHRPVFRSEAMREEQQEGEGKERIVCRYTGFRQLYHCFREPEDQPSLVKVF